MCAATVLREVLTTCVPTSWFHVNFLWFLRCCCLRWYQSMLIFNLAAVGKCSFRAPRSQVRPLLCDFGVCVCVFAGFRAPRWGVFTRLVVTTEDTFSAARPRSFCWAFWLDVMSGHKQLWEVFWCRLTYSTEGDESPKLLRAIVMWCAGVFCLNYVHLRSVCLHIKGGFYFDYCFYVSEQAKWQQTTYHVCHCHCPRSFHVSVYWVF